MGFKTFCANYPRWANKQPESDLADCEMTVLGDLAEIGLGIDRLVGAFAAQGLSFLEEHLLGRLGGFLKYNNLVARIDSQGVWGFILRVDGGGGGTSLTSLL